MPFLYGLERHVLTALESSPAPLKHVDAGADGIIKGEKYLMRFEYAVTEVSHVNRDWHDSIEPQTGNPGVED